MCADVELPRANLRVVCPDLAGVGMCAVPLVVRACSLSVHAFQGVQLCKFVTVCWYEPVFRGLEHIWRVCGGI